MVYLKKIFSNMTLPRTFAFIDLVQILLIAVFVYYFMLWIKRTRAYSLIKGLVVVVIFLLIVWITGMQTILWICKNFSTVVLVALVVIFQPELRHVLEQLGEKNVIAITPFLDSGRSGEEKISDASIEEIIRAVYDMGEAKTGALIVLENEIKLDEYEKTGIGIDAVITCPLLINIFEHNTPLHDGAVLIHNDRILSATCYLPLSDNMSLNKNLGTRHRAAVGISEVSDALTIVVSEETGHVSYTYKGRIFTGCAPEEIRQQLRLLQNKPADKDTKEKKRRWKSAAQDKDISE